MSREEKLVLIHGVDDWYLYGLALADVDFIKALYRSMSDAVERVVQGARAGVPAVRDTTLGLFALQEDWPYRDGRPRLGKYVFDRGAYWTDRIDYKGLGHPPSRFDRLFTSLESAFQNGDELQAAEDLIEQRLQAFVAAYLKL